MLDTLYSNAFNIAVDCAASGANTLYAVPAGERLAVLYAFLQAENDVEVTVKSGSTAISGPINFTTASSLRERTFSNAGAPVFKTVASGDDLVLTLSGGVQVNGFLTAVKVNT